MDCFSDKKSYRGRVLLLVLLLLIAVMILINIKGAAGKPKMKNNIDISPFQSDARQISPFNTDQISVIETKAKVH